MATNQEPAYSSGFAVQKVEVDPVTGRGQIMFTMSPQDAAMIQQHIDMKSRISIHFTVRPAGPVDLAAASPSLPPLEKKPIAVESPNRATSIADYIRS